ncbi:MAG: hypothetical protein IH586_08370, partial [Anaerolineaceae bacterium]|nr:hypothetical protein [Anaerolineaceae bacterium]
MINLLKTKLILIEGIPGSGKTSAARYTNEWLESNGIKAALYLEGNLDHPADYESVACLNQQMLEQIAARYPAQWELIQKYSTKRSGETFIKFQKMRNDLGPETIPDDLFHELGGYEIYNGLSLADFSRVAKDYWAEFTCSAQNEEQIFVFECCFLQNPITNFLGRHNSDLSALSLHLAQTAAVIEPLHPALVYLDPGDVYITLQRAVDTRPTWWYEGLIHYITGQGYGKAYHLEGLSGIARFYEMMREIQVAFLQTWQGP